MFTRLLLGNFSSLSSLFSYIRTKQCAELRAELHVFQNLGLAFENHQILSMPTIVTVTETYSYKLQHIIPTYCLSCRNDLLQ